MKRSYPTVDLDDAVQAAYLRFLQLDSTDHIGDPRYYFYRTVVSVIVQQLRRDRLIAFEPLDSQHCEEACGDLEGEHLLDARRQLRRLESAILRLRPCQQAVVRMRRLEGQTATETARNLGLSVSAIEKHQTAALRQLAVEIGYVFG